MVYAHRRRLVLNMRRLLREPLLHFFVLGLVLLVARAALMPVVVATFNPGVIRVTADEMSELRARWREQTNRSANAEEMRGLVRDYVNKKVLFAEAKRLGLQRSDVVVRQRLIRNLRFADPASKADDAALLQTAYVMGMADHDPVVRQRLVERMRQRIESRAKVTEEQLQDYIATHRAQYALAPRYSFQQLFFKRGPEAEIQAQQVLLSLRSDNPTGPAQLGDAFMSGRHYRNISGVDIERRFGAAFFARVEQARVDAWVGPVATVYGQHLIRVEAVTPGGLAADEVIRPRALSILYKAQERACLKAALQRLRGHYRIEIADDAEAVAL